jgi:non-ribosomal peptide synthetase component F
MDMLMALSAQKDIYVGTEDLSLLGVFVTVLFAYLHRISGKRHLSISITYHNRISRAFEETIGNLMQVLPLRVRIQPHETFLSLNKKVITEILNNFKHVPFCLSDPNEHKKSQVLLNYVNSPVPGFDGLQTISEWVHCGYQYEPMVLNIHKTDSPGMLGFEFDFNPEIFNEEERNQTIVHFCQMLDAFGEDLNCPLDRTDLLWKESQRRKLSSLESEIDFDFSPVES